MNKIVVCMPLVAGLLAAPLAVARADVGDWDSSCRTGLALNFCGSVQLSMFAIAGATALALHAYEASPKASLGPAISFKTGASFDTQGDGMTYWHHDDSPDDCKQSDGQSLSAIRWSGVNESYSNGEDDEDCGPHTTTTPEPATIALVGTGMMALVGSGITSRRRTNHSI